jgi:hypothetical protein
MCVPTQLAKESGVFSPFLGFGLAKIPAKRAKTYLKSSKKGEKTYRPFRLAVKPKSGHKATF